MSRNRDNPKWPEWMDLDALTQYACVSRRTLADWIADPVDPLPAQRVKGKLFVRCHAFDDYMERHPVERGNVVDEILKDL